MRTRTDGQVKMWVIQRLNLVAWLPGFKFQASDGFCDSVSPFVAWAHGHVLLPGLVWVLAHEHR